MAREIPLTKGYVALVDDEDYERVITRKWHAAIFVGAIYAVNATYDPETKRSVKETMQRFILGSRRGFVIDHESGDTLDNTRGNLRFATRGQNAANGRKPRHGRYPFKGIWRHHKRWGARVVAKGKSHFCGLFATPEEAARAYDRKAREVHGEFACVNFPEPGERGALEAHSTAPGDAAPTDEQRALAGSICKLGLSFTHSVTIARVLAPVGGDDRQDVARAILAHLAGDFERRMAA